jgi:hypothetical protein
MKFNTIIFLCILFEYLVSFTLQTKTSTKTETSTQLGTFANASFGTKNVMSNQVSFHSSFLLSKSKNKKAKVQTRAATSTATNTNIKSTATATKATSAIKTKQVPINSSLSDQLNQDNPSLSGITTPKLGIGKNGQLTTVEDQSRSENKKQFNDYNYNPINWQGWISFYKYNGSKGPSHLTHFFQNPDYFTQFKFDAKLDLTAESTGLNKHQINVPKQSKFYGILYKNDMTISRLSPEKGSFITVYDDLNLTFINTVLDVTNKYEGGIEDFGHFNEGECFKVYTKISGSGIVWVICLEDSPTKIALMEALRSAKIQIQRNAGILTQPRIDKQPSLDTLADWTAIKEQKVVDDQKRMKEGKGDFAIDGYWQLLQDWSQCDLKCGGGKSTLQRMCIPPLPGGKPCNGEAIITRVCNRHPCPDGDKSLQDMVNTNSTTTNETVLSPKITVMPFSDIPQRYEVIIIIIFFLFIITILIL